MTNSHQQADPTTTTSASASGGSFDPYVWEHCFFFGPLERKEAERLLADCEVGTFLLRESTSKPGYSLTVKEAEGQIHNYLIEKIQQEDNKIKYSISNLLFADIPSLLNYFKLCQLERTTLRKPLEKPAMERVIGRYKFEGERISDLPFERGETLDVLSKPEEKWWIARNCLGNTGLIPINYVKVYEEGDEMSLHDPSTKTSGSNNSGESSGGGGAKRFSTNSAGYNGNNGINGINETTATTSCGMEANGHQQQQMGAEQQATIATNKMQPNSWVRVVADRWPSIYDVEALKIRAGQLLWLQEILPNGMCRGVAKEDVASGGGKSGLFPITYVEPVRGGVPMDVAAAGGGGSAQTAERERTLTKC